MIVLDTNVISALMLRKPDKQVIDWLDSQASETIWTTSITVFEIRFGLEILSDSTRKRQLQDVFEVALTEELAGRVLEFDHPAANEAALLSAQRRRSGRPIEIRDAMICGIARARRATIVTRNVKHFDDAQVAIVNPWED